MPPLYVGAMTDGVALSEFALTFDRKRRRRTLPLGVAIERITAMEPTVYLAKLPDNAERDAQARAFSKALSATGFLEHLRKLDMVAVKVHVGEKNNTTHARPELAAEAVKMAHKAGAQCFLTDTATLYKGERENAIRHTIHAYRHGFHFRRTGAPFIAVDGISGTDETETVVNGELHKAVKVAGQILLADAMVVISHATGHVGSGIGAAIKNVGMGLSSRSGKMRQHSSISPEVLPDKCENCGKCRKWCPTEAISEREGVSYIAREACIGCGECIAVCRYGAVKFDYEIESALLQKSMAEHAAGVIRHFGPKAVYLNVLIDMTRDCDCLNKRQKKQVPDIGMIASTDIVAVDQATLDLTAREHGANLAEKYHPSLDPGIQIEHAEKMGLGSRNYKLEVL
jgi:uncharacterized Fe-S center protein